jgi:hypothetical protein
MNVPRNSERAENLAGFASVGAHVCRGLPEPFDLHMSWAVQSALLVAGNVSLTLHGLKCKILRPITVGVFLTTGRGWWELKTQQNAAPRQPLLFEAEPAGDRLHESCGQLPVCTQKHIDYLCNTTCLLRLARRKRIGRRSGIRSHSFEGHLVSSPTALSPSYCASGQPYI